MLSALEQRRTRELSVQVATLAENPTLKVAAANFKLEGTTNPDFRRGLIAAINRELEALAATDVVRRPRRSRRVGYGARRWRSPQDGLAGAGAGQSASRRHRFGLRLDRLGRVSVRLGPLTLQHQYLGTLQLAKALDGRYAQELATLSGAATLIASDDRVIATTLPADLVRALTPAIVRTLPRTSSLFLADSRVRGPAACSRRVRRTCTPWTQSLRRRRSRCRTRSVPCSSSRSDRSRSPPSRACGWRARSRARSTRCRRRSPR